MSLALRPPTAPSATVPPAAAVTAPATPRKPKRADEVDRIIRGLNKQYALAIRFPDVSLSPLKRKEKVAGDFEAERCHAIHSHLHRLYYRDDAALDAALDEFRAQADARTRDWVAKPLADRDTLPAVSGPVPLLADEGRHELQSILLCLLQVHAPQVLPRRPILAKRVSDHSPQRSSPKRPRSQRSDRSVSPSPARPVDDGGHGPAFQPPVRFQPRGDAAGTNQSLSHRESFNSRSANTSRLSLVSEVFSRPADSQRSLPASQTTADPASQPAKPFGDSSVSPRIAEVRAPDESVAALEPPELELPDEDITTQPFPSPEPDEPDAHFTDAQEDLRSSSPELPSSELREADSPGLEEAEAFPAKAPVKGLEARLTSIWREFRPRNKRPLEHSN